MLPTQQKLLDCGPAAVAATRSINEQLRKIRTTIDQLADDFDRARAAVATLIEQARVAANSDVSVAGLEARWYTRAALDPMYATPEALDVLVGRLLSADSTYEGLGLLTREHRAVVAAAAIRGWARYHDTPPAPEGIAWGRLLGDTRVLVSREPAA